MKDNLIASKAGICYLTTQDGSKFFYGLLDSSSLEQTSNTELLTSSPSAHTIAKIFYNKQMSISIMPTLFSTRFEMLQNSSITDVNTVTTNISTHEQVVATDGGTGEAEVTIDGTPVDDNVDVVDMYNKSYSATFATGTVSITDGTPGDTYIVMYEEEQTDVEQVDFARDSFPENVELTITVIASDPDSGTPEEMWYYNFPICSPSGEFTASLEKETNSAVDVSFDILTGITGKSYGTKTIVPIT